MGRKQLVLPVFLFVVLPYIYDIFSPYTFTAIGAGWFAVLFPLILVPIAVKRLHDIGQSRWFAVFAIIPLINLLFFLLLLCVPGVKKTNMYGKPPTTSSQSWFKESLIYIVPFFVIIATVTLAVGPPIGSYHVLTASS